MPAVRLISKQARNARKLVETRIKTENAIDSVIFHYGKMHSIACGQSRIPQYNFFGPLYGNPIDRKYLVNAAEQSIESRLNGVAPLDRSEAVQYLLQDFRIRDQALPLADKLFEQSLGVGFVNMRAAYHIHGDIRVDQNHGFLPTP